MEANNLVEGLIDQFNVQYKGILGDKLAEKPTYEYDVAEGKSESKFKFYGIGFSYSKKVRFNIMIFQHGTLIDAELPNLYGFYRAVTFRQKDIALGGMQLGTIIDQPMPGGFLFDLKEIHYVKNEADERKSKVNPVGELVNKDKKLRHLLTNLPQKTSFSGLEYVAPRWITVTPFKKRTIACVTCVLPKKGWEKYKLLPEKKKKINVSIPKLDHVPGCLEILKRIKHYVTQVGFTKETRGLVPKVLLPRLILAKLLDKFPTWVKVKENKSQK